MLEGMGVGFAILNRVRKAHRKATFKQKLDNSEKNEPSTCWRETLQAEGLEVGACLRCLRNSKEASVTGVE